MTGYSCGVGSMPNDVPMLVGEDGVTRLKWGQSPQGDGTKPGEKNSDNEARGSGGLPGVHGGVGDSSNKSDVAPGIDPAHIDALKQAAASGDKEATDLLKALGISLGVAGGAAGGYAIYKAMQKKKTSGPGDEASSPSNKAGKALIPSQPDTVHLNEVEIPRTAGYLDTPVKKVSGPTPQKLLPAPAPALEDAAKAAKAARRLIP